MDLVSFFSQANLLKGKFVQVGFSKGTNTKHIFDAMNSGNLTKRQTFIFDSFTGRSSGRLGLAMDMRFSLTNPNTKVEVIRGLIQETIPSKYDSSTIACILIDLTSYSDVVHTLTKLHKNLIRDGLIYVSQYDTDTTVKSAVDSFIERNNLKHQVFKLGESTYIRNKVAPVSFIKPAVTKSDRAPEETISVSRPKPPQPFEDRYEKPVIEKFVPKKEIKKGLQVIGNKVTK